MCPFCVEKVSLDEIPPQTPIRIASMSREESAELHRKSQVDQALKMVERQSKFHNNLYQVKPGTVVTCKVDARDVTHPRGIIGVVTAANETGAVKVVCEHGMLSHKGSSQWWIPSDKYKVIAKADEVANISPELLATRNDVMTSSLRRNNQQFLSKRLISSRSGHLALARE